jgi:hypothetical protein
MSDPLNPYASPQADEMLAPGARWVQGDSASLRKTATGLSLVYYGIVLLLLAIPFALFGILLGAFGLGFVGFSLAVLSLIAGMILEIVGPLVCLAVPAETRTKGYIVGSVLLQWANLAPAILIEVFRIQLHLAIQESLNLIGFAAFVLFVLFMKGVAEYIARPDLAARARNILVVMGVLVAGIVVAMLVIVSGTFGSGLALLGAILAFAMFIVAVVVLVMYANLVNTLRKALVSEA